MWVWKKEKRAVYFTQTTSISLTEWCRRAKECWATVFKYNRYSCISTYLNGGTCLLISSVLHWRKPITSTVSVNMIWEWQTYLGSVLRKGGLDMLEGQKCVIEIEKTDPIWQPIQYRNHYVKVQRVTDSWIQNPVNLVIGSFTWVFILAKKTLLGGLQQLSKLAMHI